MPSRSIRSYGMQLDPLAVRSISATVPSSPSALRATSTIEPTLGSRLIRTAAARPMPWLAPVITQTLPIVSPRGR